MTNLKKIIAISILSLMCSPFYAMNKGKGKAFIIWSPETKQETPVTAPSTAIEKDPTPGPKEVQPSLTESLPESLTSEEQFEADTATAKKESLMNELPSVAGPSDTPIAKKSTHQIMYTKHGQQRMEQREISEEKIEKVIRGDKTLGVSRKAAVVSYTEKNKTSPTIVVAADDSDGTKVITTYTKVLPIIFSKTAYLQMKKLGANENRVKNIVREGFKRGSIYTEKTDLRPLKVKTVIVDEKHQKILVKTVTLAE